MIAGRFGKIQARAKAFPLKALVVVSVLCLALQEEYPFSHFPMYSSFSDYTYYVYVVDREGKPIPLETITSVRTSKLKKIFQDQLNPLKDEFMASGRPWTGFRRLGIEDRRPAGEYALDWIVSNCKADARDELEALRPLGFHQVGVWVDGKAMTEVDERIAGE